MAEPSVARSWEDEAEQIPNLRVVKGGANYRRVDDALQEREQKKQANLQLVKGMQSVEGNEQEQQAKQALRDQQTAQSSSSPQSPSSETSTTSQSTAPSTKNNTSPAASAKTKTEVLGLGADAAAKKAYQQIWNTAQFGVEGFALAFTDATLVSGPIAIILFLARAIIGNLFNGGGTLKFQNVNVPLVPGYGWADGLAHSVSIVAIAVLVAIVYPAVFLVILAIVRPDIVASAALCGVMGPLVKFFGFTICS